MNKGMGGHQCSTMLNDEWLTPKYITDALAPFDLDPCSPINRPWSTAKKHYTIKDNGLLLPWDGFVWCNPPYGKEVSKWLDLMSKHNNGIALIFARVETKAFEEQVWDKASCLLFIYGRLTFLDVTGKKAKANGGAPSVLIGYGEEAKKRLSIASLIGDIKGKYIEI